MKAIEIADILKNRFGNESWVEINKASAEITILNNDSRNHVSSDEAVFIALATQGGNDGHQYIADAYKKGIRNFIVSEIPVFLRNGEDINIFKVPDTLAALAALGKSKTKNAKEILAITGSRGKTTLKEILFQLLEGDVKVSRSPRSFNSKIGVPLSLWNIAKDTDIAIIEAGISKEGEMANLSEIITPDTVIFTNIGDAHSSGFTNKESKAAEKAILAEGKRVKLVIYPKDDIYLDEKFKSYDGDKRVLGWSLKDPSSELFIRGNSKSMEYTWKNKTEILSVEIDKDYDLENYANALAYLLAKGYKHTEIEKKFRNLHKINTRLNVSEGINGCSVVLDSYTSDLSSLSPAIDFILRRKLPFQSVTLMISDLHHEGNRQGATYEEMAKIVRAAGISKFIGIGKSMNKFKSLFPKNSKFYLDTESLLNDFSLTDFNNEIILLKGSPEYNFGKIYEQLEVKKHETVLEVNLDALLRNYNYFRSHIPSTTGIIAMVKASGYGAGSYEIAKTLQDAGASYLAVAALDEGLDLRKNGITMPVMIMNPHSANYRSLFQNRLEPVIYTMSMVRPLMEEAELAGAKEYPVHIKLDTGMHRMGFLEKEIEELSALLKSSGHIKVSTIFSHLATADCLDMDAFTIVQLKKFETISDMLINQLGYEVDRHILNSAGILRFPEWHYQYVRLGIGLYGANTLPPEIEKPLYPVSTLRSVIICIREVDIEDAIGYSRKGIIRKKSKIATLPIGYADGMNRKFGNGAIKVLINGKYAPTIGNICMDAMMIDVTDIDCQEGDPVEIFGENLPVQTLSDALGTIPYEVLTSVSPRVKRIYYRE